MSSGQPRVENGHSALRATGLVSVRATVGPAKHDVSKTGDNRGRARHHEGGAPARNIDEYAGHDGGTGYAHIAPHTVDAESDTGIHGPRFHDHGNSHRVVDGGEHADQKQPGADFQRRTGEAGQHRACADPQEEHDHHAATTPAIRQLRDAGAVFSTHPYKYLPNGGAANSATALNVPLHSVIKTLVLVNNADALSLMLMHGDREVSTKQLARAAGVRSLEPATASQATKATGYQFGGTSPFGTRRPLPCFVERSVFELDRLYINGGARGLLVAMSPKELDRVLQPHWVSASQPQ